MAKNTSLFKRLILFLVLVVALVTSLKLLDWLGDSINDEGVRRFTSIESARRYLALEELYLPVYRPQQFQWPPSEILARRTPYRQLILHVSGSESNQIILAIAQTESPEAEIDLRLEVADIRRTTEIQLEGRSARLVEGLCNTGGTCYQLTWSEESRRIRLVAKLTSEEVIRLAESMLAG
jgi:hypothetical protein